MPPLARRVENNAVRKFAMRVCDVSQRAEERTETWRLGYCRDAMPPVSHRRRESGKNLHSQGVIRTLKSSTADNQSS